MVRSTSRYLKAFLRFTFAASSFGLVITFLIRLRSPPNLRSSARKLPVFESDPLKSPRKTRLQAQTASLSDQYDGPPRITPGSSWLQALYKQPFKRPSFMSANSRTAGAVARPLMEASASPPAIKITASDRPPRLGDLPAGNPISGAYLQALEQIDIAVDHILKHDPVISTPAFKTRTAGVPGTGIRTDAGRKALQDWLSCTSGQGEWRWEPTTNRTTSRPLTVHKQGASEARCDRAFYSAPIPLSPLDGWHVRPSLKFRWHASARCDALRPPRIPPGVSLSRREMCRLLRNKSTLIVGDASQYALHDLLLDWTNTKQTTCYGSLYCKEHGICGDELKDDWTGHVDLVEAGELDGHVYHKLPPQPLKRPRPSTSSTTPRASDDLLLPPTPTSPAQKQSSSPSTPSSSPTRYGTILRYRRSDSIWGSSSPSNPRFQPIWLHPNTGIRDINNFWLADARKSDVVILSRRPLPMPLPSHLRKAFMPNTDLPVQHMSFLRDLPRNKAWGGGREIHGSGIEAAAAMLIEMARRMVLEVWLPEVLATLLAVRGHGSTLDSLIIWRGEWRMHADCRSNEPVAPADSASEDETFDWNEWWRPRARGDGPPPYPGAPTLLPILFPGLPAYRALVAPNRTLSHPRLVFHNVQVILQNQLMRAISPAFGIPFLDLESQASVWRSGHVGSCAKPTATAVDCFNYCFPSPGMAIEEGFLGGLLKVFRAGWEASSDSNTTTRWTGEGFVPIRKKHL